MNIKSVLRNKETRNAGWLIAGKIMQMGLSLIISILTARYLGPSNYGLINYVLAYTSFFSAFCTLGINGVIIKDFVDNPDQQGLAIGSTIVLRAISSLLSGIMIVTIVYLIDNDSLTTVIAILCSVALVFQVFDTINYWFQSKYMSKITSIATLVAYIIVSLYRVLLLVLGKSVVWFAFCNSIDYIVIAIFLLVSYKKYGGPKLSFSIDKSKQLLKNSYHYILSSMMVAIYAQTDKFMIKRMIDEKEVGFYSIATAICTMWVFVLQAIIDSMQPTILNLYKKDGKEFERKNRQLYCIVFYVSIIVSISFQLLGHLVVNILYGEEYLPSVTPLRIVTWYTAFSYLGVARNAWIVCENKQKYLKYMYMGAAIINVLLNLLLIPCYKASGAALASLVTQIFTSLVLPLFWKDMRANVKLMIEGITFRRL